MSRSRTGSATVPLILIFSIVTAVLITWAYFGFNSDSAVGENGNILRAGATTHQIKKEHLRITVSEDANLVSGSNVEIKCQVAGGSAIQFIVDDGSFVKKGELVVRLESTVIEEQEIQQEGVLEKAKATLIQATQDEAAALISIAEYEKGLFVQAKQLAEAQITIANENLRSSQNLLEHTKKMARKGFAPPTQVEADEFAVRRAELEKAAANTALEVLEQYTKEKTLKQLNATYEAAKARAKSEQTAVNLEQKKFDNLKKQFEHCTLLAPQDGMVVYANERSRSGNVEILLGGPVRYTQSILRMPLLTNMEAKVLVNESKIALLKEDMPAKITIQGDEFKGKVRKIASQPESSQSWGMSAVKEYATDVTLDGDTSGLKPGMTARVEITVAEFPNQLVIPVAAVVELGRKHYCWLNTANGVERRHLTLGMTDDKVIAVVDGVAVDDIVILNPRAVVPESRDSLKADEDAVENGNDKSTEAGNDKGSADGGKPDAGATGSDSTNATPSPGKASGKSKTKGAGAGFPMQTFAERDTNGDGQITKDELSGRAAETFDTTDANGDGHIDKAEYAKWSAALRARMQQMQSGGGGPQ